MAHNDDQQLSSTDEIDVREGEDVDVEGGEEELDMSDEPSDDDPYGEDTEDEMDMTLYSMYPNEENKELYY